MNASPRPTLRSTALWALAPAVVVYAIALLWSDAEGISSTLVLRDLAQSCNCLLYTSPSPRD